MKKTTLKQLLAGDNFHNFDIESKVLRLHCCTSPLTASTEASKSSWLANPDRSPFLLKLCDFIIERFKNQVDELDPADEWDAWITSYLSLPRMSPMSLAVTGQFLIFSPPSYKLFESIQVGGATRRDQGFVHPQPSTGCLAFMMETNPRWGQ